MKPPTLAEQDAERRVRNVENAGRYANPPVLDLSPILETIPADVLAAVEVPSAATVRAALDRAEAMRARPKAGVFVPDCYVCGSSRHTEATIRGLACQDCVAVDAGAAPRPCVGCACKGPRASRTQFSVPKTEATRRELAEARALLAEGVAVVEKAECERDAHRAAAMAAMGLLQQLREAGKLPKWAKEQFKETRDAWLDATKEET